MLGIESNTIASLGHEELVIVAVSSTNGTA